MPAFWDTHRRPMVTHTSDFTSDPKSKQDKVNVTNSKKKIAKTWNLEILQENLTMTHLLKLIDKMCKYKMDPTKTVGATEWTRDAGWTDGRTRTDWNQYTPPTPNNFVCEYIQAKHYG